MMGEIGAHACDSVDKIEAGLSISFARPGPQPCLSMGLHQSRARTDDLSAFSAGISRRTQLQESPDRPGLILLLPQGALAGGLAGAIEVEADGERAGAVTDAPEERALQSIC